MGIPLTYIRSSMLAGKKMCELKMVGEYVLGWTDLSNQKADKGTICHKVMEILACAKLAQQNGEKFHYDEEIVGKITANVKKINVDSLVDTIYNYYSRAFDHHDWTDKDLKDCREWTWKALHYQDGHYDPRKQKIIQPEAQFDFSLPEEWATYSYKHDGETLEGVIAAKGTIDLIVEIAPNHYEICDYKFGQRKDWGTGERKTYDDLMNDIQLRLYQLAAYKIFPNLEHLVVTIFYVRDEEGPVSLFFEKSDIADTMEKLRKEVKRMQELENPKLVKHDRRVKPWLKPCRFCPLAKNTFEGTEVVPLYKNNGEAMTQCEQLEFVLKHRPMKSVIENMKKKDFDFCRYKAPGSVE